MVLMFLLFNVLCVIFIPTAFLNFYTLFRAYSYRREKQLREQMSPTTYGMDVSP